MIKIFYVHILCRHGEQCQYITTFQKALARLSADKEAYDTVFLQSLSEAFPSLLRVFVMHQKCFLSSHICSSTWLYLACASSQYLFIL